VGRAALEHLCEGIGCRKARTCGRARGMYGSLPMRLAMAIAALALLAGTAGAQPGMPPPTPVAPLPPPPLPPGSELSESTALWLSLGGTAVSWGLVVASFKANTNSSFSGGLGVVAASGTLFAPSFGHWYAREGFTRGFGLRLLAGGLAFAAVVVALSECPLFAENCHESGVAPVLAIGAAGLYVGGTIDDIATAPSAVRSYRQRLHGVALVPVIR